MENKKYASLELKVGLTVGIALLALAVIIFTVEKFQFGKQGYPLDISFQFVDAINPQADVVIGGGVKIGRVESIRIDGERIHLKVVINPNVRIPSDAKFQILSKGLMGDKYLNVVPQASSKEFLKPGDHVEGVEPANIDKAFQRLGQVADSIRALFGDPEMKTTFTDMIKNLSSLSSSLDLTVKRNLPNIDNSVKRFSTAMKDLERFSADLPDITRSLEEVLAVENRENLRLTLRGLKESSQLLSQDMTDISKGKGALGVLINDEQVAKDLKQLVKEVKEHPWKLLWK